MWLLDTDVPVGVVDLETADETAVVLAVVVLVTLLLLLLTPLGEVVECDVTILEGGGDMAAMAGYGMVGCPAPMGRPNNDA